MEETEETDGACAHSPAVNTASMLMPSSSSEISTETSLGKQESRGERSAVGKESLIHITPESDKEVDVGGEDVVIESCNGDLKQPISNEEDTGPSFSKIHESDGLHSISICPGFHSQEARDLHEMSTPARAYFSEDKAGSSSRHPAQLSRQYSPRTIFIMHFVIAPKSVETVKIRPRMAVRSEQMSRVDALLGKGIDGKLFAWYCSGEVDERLPLSGEMSVVYETCIDEDELPGSLLADLPFIASIKNRLLENVRGGERASAPSKITEVELPNHRIHLAVCDERGAVKHQVDYTLMEWLTVLRTLIAVTNKHTFRDAVAEYFHKRPNQFVTMFMSEKQSSVEPLKAVVQWASQVQEGIAEERSSTGVSKLGIVSLALLELLAALRNVPRGITVKGKELAKAFFEALVPLNKFFKGLGPNYFFLEQEQVRHALQATIAPLVSCVSPFECSWINHLEMFFLFDPTLEFLNEWRPLAFGDMDHRDFVRFAGKQYNNAIRELCGNAHLFKSSEEKLAASGCALQAAPTVEAFFQAALQLEKARWLLVEEFNQSIAVDHVRLMDDALDKCFSKIIEQHESLGGRKGRLQQQLEMALNVEMSSVYPFLATNLRDHLIEIFQEILVLEDESQGVLRDPLSAFKSRRTSITDLFLSLVTSPLAFTSPLRSHEMHLVSTFSSTSSSKTYASLQIALVSLANDEISYVEYQEVLQVWIQGASRRLRKVNDGGYKGHGYLPPHSFVAAVEELLLAGVKPSFAPFLSQMAMSMAVEECPSLPAFLLDSKEITLSQARVVQNHYLEAAGRMMEDVFNASQTRTQLSDAACAALQAIFQEANRGNLQLHNLIGEHLCVKLLDTIMNACGDLRDELRCRPIETLMEFKFATLLMQIEKCPQNIKSHELYEEIYTACGTLGASLQSERVSLRYIISSSLSGDWEKIFHFMGNASFVAAVKKAHKDLLVYRKRLQGFEVLVYTICPFLTDNNVRVVDYTKWRDWLAMRSSEWKNFTLRQIHSSPDHWPSEVHTVIFDYLDHVITLHGSRVFLNILLEAVPGRAERTSPITDYEKYLEITVPKVANELFPQAVHQYKEEMRLYVAMNVKFDKILMERVCVLLDGVDSNAVETEFECARRQLGWSSTEMHEFLKRSPENGTNIVDYLQLWKGVSVLKELHAILPLVASVFDLNEDCDGLVQRIWNVVTECTLQCSLQLFREVLQKDGRTVLALFSTSELDIFKELTKTGHLIMFLRESVQEDLRHLLDAVEDPNATQTWEGLINDLIDLQRIFRPILCAKTACFKDLREAVEVELKTSRSNSHHLCEKLKACNKEAHGLRQYFLGVANRMYKDNDQIAGILNNGKYFFSLSEDGCFLVLVCSNVDPLQSESSKSSGNTQPHVSSQDLKSYSLTQLQELRSRARWTISSNTYVKKSKTAQTFGADWASTDAETIETTERCAVVFISHIDVAEQIVAILTKLHSCGHFFYGHFERVVSSFVELQTLTDLLNSELATWNAALLRARMEFLCLNFFRSVELRLILEVLLLPKSVEQSFESIRKLEHFFDLFKWAGVLSVDLNIVQRSVAKRLVPDLVAQIAESAHDKGERIYDCLGRINSVIESSMFQKKIVKKSDVAAESSATKKSQDRVGILLADVDDPNGELDAVAALFSERNLILHENASNVIVCGPSTAWEDLNLLMLRYLNNVGRKDFFYCIAYVERLAFDCQAELVTFVQNISHEYQIHENELALVSCSRSKFLQSLSQRLQVQVRHMATGTRDALGIEGNNRCKHVRVITSDLPGMGKTRYVQELAETQNYEFSQHNSIRTLTISGEVSRNLLIQRLKNLFKCPPVQNSSIFLHLDISVVSNSETLNDLLFELLVLGCLKSDRAGLFHLDTKFIAIEVANTYHNYLASKLPITRWFQTEHLIWNMENFEPSASITSDVQVVCNYLSRLQAGTIDTWNLEGKDRIYSMFAISKQQCRQLLQQYFVDHLRDQCSASFSSLETFNKLFAQQLREFGACPFFVSENLIHMSAQANTRSMVVRSILEVSRDLSRRSVKPWLDEQQEPTMCATADVLMAARMDNMLRWSDSKHVMIFFQLIGRMTVLYKHLSHVPTPLVDLFHSQGAKLPNYESLTSAQLYEELWPILHKTRPQSTQDSLYVLTADNFLKMALIFTKVKADVPVVIMGETGCGKTSLLRQLAHYCCVTFLSITLHAGTTEDNIRTFLLEADTQASNLVVWAFLDEINACDHLGLLVGVICHRLLDGKPLHSNVKVLAACNPYRKHDSQKQRAGLSAQTPNFEHSDKAYTVHPLPEALVENVQDFGILNAKDEQLYIEAMVLKSTKCDRLSFPFVELIVMSQIFLKEKCGEASVSLRDARRCIDLFLFFSQDLATRPSSMFLTTERRTTRAALLSFAHCYYYRLASDEERRKYKKKYVATINGSKRRFGFKKGGYTVESFENELIEEQMNLLDHMEIPPGIAKNQALRENVFVTLTCVLLKIPLFVVGKPGSGKTLSLQLIFSNLRGSGMKDPYFRQKPTMFMFSYQGSESSTSEGILKVFSKAYRCVEDNKRKNVNAVVVVVLDEVGLAEISSHNPLKVLHSLLEPDGDKQVSVVGISNWSLDAAKMNRAIHLSQPDPSVSDLVATGEAILDSYGMRKIYGEKQMAEMKWLAAVYHEYHVSQSKPDFHGLRDFYSLVKSLRGDEKVPKRWTPDDLVQAVWRNFGGSPKDTASLIGILNRYFPQLRFEPPPALDLVKANLDDVDARHLMLISTGESGVGIIENMLPQKEKLIIVHGSKYKDDCSDDYAYLMLSNIILHMEHGRHILLKGVERVWSSLYDMLNQHYTIVGGRRNCRIAIGAFSNPMCYVHDNFRCIVVVDQSQVQSLDPPFLNRFEKQVLTWEALLTPQQEDDVQVLKVWVKAMACTSEDDTSDFEEDVSFSESDLIAGYSGDMIASLVLKNWDTQSSHEAFLTRCKEELLLIAYPDGIMRAHYSRTCLRGAPDAKTWTNTYFQKRSDQESLLFKIRDYICDKALWQDDLGCKLVLTTRSNVHTNVRLLLKDLHDVKMQIIKLGDFTAERQLNTAIQLWSESFNDLLIIQSDTVLDKDHLLLAKVHVERIRTELFAQAQQGYPRQRHVVFLLHSHRGEQEISSPFSFLSGWKQITLDQLHQEDTDYREYLDKSISELFQSERFREGHNLMLKVLTWSFLCIKYPRGRQSASYCQQMVHNVCNDKDLYHCFILRAVMWLEEDAKKDTGKEWQTSVVCNRGRLALASNLHYAFSQYVEEKLREPIAKLVYVLESKSALGSYFNMTLAQRELWRQVFLDRQMINIDNVPQPMHPEGYTILDPLQLNLPWSSLYAEHVDKHMQELYLSRVTNPDVNGLALGMAKDVTVSLQSNPSMKRIEECVTENPDDYFHDFAMLYAPYQSNVRNAEQALVFEWLLRKNVSELKVPLMLHALVWQKAETLKGQTLLASSCYRDEEIASEVEKSKCSRIFSKEFDVKFALLCVQKMLPSDMRVIENAGGLEKWLHQFDVLIKLVSNISGNAFIMLMLRVLQDFARLVVLTFSVTVEDLCSFSHWFQRQNCRPSLQSLLTKIISLLPDVNALQGLHREMYFRFIASTFCRLLDATSVPSDVIFTMSGVIFRLKAPTCLMKGVVVKLLETALAIYVPAPKLDCPGFVQLSFLKGRNFVKEQALQSEYYEPYILLCDVIYDSVKGSITPELMSGVDTAAFSFENLLLCLSQVTRELTLLSGTLNLRVACSFAVMRAVMEVLAQELVIIFRKDPGIFKPRLAAPITIALSAFFTQGHYNVLAMNQYLMKVLRYHHGLSVQNLSYLSNECRRSEILELYSLILDWHMLKEVDNPLGFNPFTTLFSRYDENVELLWNTIYAEGEKLQMLKERMQDLSSADQGAMASAVASKVFLVNASRKLYDKEVTMVSWLQQEGSLETWEHRWQNAVNGLVGNGPLQLSCDSTSDQLQFKALAAHILIVVSSLAASSPLRGYLALSETHITEAFVLALPNNLLASLRGALQSREALKAYKHECGYVYMIGNCTMANQRAKCPNCGGTIGGANHTLDPNNYPLAQNVKKGYIMDEVARSDTLYIVRDLERKAFRALRILVNFCILLGLYMGRNPKKLAASMHTPDVMKELESMIEEDLVMLGTLLAGNREASCQFMHCVVASISTNYRYPEGPLFTCAKRSAWESAFQLQVKKFDTDVKKTVVTYIEAHRGRHELTEILEERHLPPFPSATAALARISVAPSFQNFQAMYMQDERRRKRFPIVERFFVNSERLSEMKHLLGLVRFSKAVHEQLASRITRPEAATISIGEYLGALTGKDRCIRESFPAFARAWNVMRFKVTAFECTEFKRGIPEMNEGASIGFCLVESRDLGIYLAALLDHLRTIQNAFLDDVAEIAAAAISDLSVRVHTCKAVEVIDFDEQWPERMVCDAAMTNLQFSQGQNIIYDYTTIAEQLRHRLVDQKPHLDQWEPFLFKHEAFHKHMTILSDVATLVPQIPLGSETLQSIQSEIELGTAGSSRYLATLDLCLGFLRRTGGDPTEAVNSYCHRWLGHEQAFLLATQVQLQHLVSLYEGLEDSASVGIQGLVNVRYRTPLSSELVEELKASVVVTRRPWQEFKISAELFHAMLRRFMFRYLIGDQLNAEVPLSIYITDPRLIQWPEDVVDDVDEVFPPGLLVEHSHATYLYLSEMLKMSSSK